MLVKIYFRNTKSPRKNTCAILENGSQNSVFYGLHKKYSSYTKKLCIKIVLQKRPTIFVFAIYKYNQPFSHEIQYLENQFGNSLKKPQIAIQGS